MDKKKVFLILLGIVVFAVLLRLINLDKQEGMWNDEYLTWEIAKAAFPKEFFEAIIRNCHAPLHYLYLKAWMYFFSDSDYSLRLSSLVPGAMSVVSMYFAGRELGKKAADSTGLVAAAFCAISSFLIYFSQEVRIYSLLFLLSSLHLIAAIKTLDNPTKKHCTFFVITALLVMLEHTIGFVFVFFSVISVILFAAKKTKFKKFFLTSLLVGFIVFIPVAIFLYNVMFNQEYFSQWWAPFSWAKLAFFFTDLFSPYLVNITNAPPSFLSMVYDGTNINWGFTLFAFIPLAISVAAMVKAIFIMDNKVKYILLTSIGVYLTVFAASLFGKILFLTKYMIEIYPLLILLAIYGLMSFKEKNIKIILGTVYLVVSVFFIVVSEYSPVKMVRSEGQNIPVVMLKVLQYKDTDKVLFLYYPKTRFMKYSKEIAQNKNTNDISKYDFTFIKDKKETMKETFKEGKETYKNIFLSLNNRPLENFLNRNIYSTIKKGDKFFLVDFTPVTLFSPQLLQKKLESEKKYEETPFLYLVFSYIRNYIVRESEVLLSLSDVVAYESWRIYVFEKT